VGICPGLLFPKQSKAAYRGEEMEEDNNPLKWALLIEKMIDPKTQNVQIKVATKGDKGMSIHEVITIVDAWVKGAKKQLQQPIIDNFHMGDFHFGKEK